jgi:phosphonoacetaldehyde hydrolase
MQSMQIINQAMNIKLVIFDWAGTLLDFGCRAPLAAFLEAFEVAGLPISEEVARRPMGAHKRDHMREILQDAEVAHRVRTGLSREPDEMFGDEIYRIFVNRLLQALPRYAQPIPGAVETLRTLRAKGIYIGSTTGYTRAMMDALVPLANAAGLTPDALICADEVPQSRPAPWACFRLAERFGVYPMARCAKVGDTPADMAEGANSGMVCVGISESGNEVGLSVNELAALGEAERARRVRAAEERLLDAGARLVLKTVAELPMWIEAQNR